MATDGSCTDFAMKVAGRTIHDVSGGHHGNIYVYGIRGEGKSATHRAAAFMPDAKLTGSSPSNRSAWRAP